MHLGLGRFGTGRRTAPTDGQGPLGFRALFSPRNPLGPSRMDIRRAWLIAILADWLQIVLLPLFGAGGLSPAQDLLDLTVAVVMVRLLGWHPALLPTFVAELIPGLDLFPTWTVSVWIATRGLAKKPRSEAVPTN
jgi:hypothetical protein